MENGKLSTQVPSSKACPTYTLKKCVSGFQVVLMLLLFFSPLFAVDNQKLIDCYEIFSQKKAELEAQAEQILEQQEALETLKNTYMALMKKKEKELNLKQKEINATLSKIENEKKEIQDLLKKNKQILEAIKEAKLNKLTQSYAKMRPKNAASILENMDDKNALEILSELPARILSKILAAMTPEKAAHFTQLMENDKNESTNTSDTGGS